MGHFRAEKNAFLKFEAGPSMDLDLQWATYYDAADQAGISRLYGGIHVPADDGPGRIIGSACGKDAWEQAKRYFSGSILAEQIGYSFVVEPNGDLKLTWEATPGFYYWIETSTDLDHFARQTEPRRAPSMHGDATVTGFALGNRAQFARVLRSAKP